MNSLLRRIGGYPKELETVALINEIREHYTNFTKCSPKKQAPLDKYQKLEELLLDDS